MFPAINESNHMSKFCINCKHFSPKLGDEEHEFARCSWNQQVSLVTGQLERSGMTFCSASRMNSAHCKPEGIHYEEQEASNV
jgi:hypothetical protein